MSAMTMDDVLEGGKEEDKQRQKEKTKGENRHRRRGAKKREEGREHALSESQSDMYRAFFSFFETSAIVAFVEGLMCVMEFWIMAHFGMQIYSRVLKGPVDLIINKSFEWTAAIVFANLFMLSYMCFRYSSAFFQPRYPVTASPAVPHVLFGWLYDPSPAVASSTTTSSPPSSSSSSKSKSSSLSYFSLPSSFSRMVLVIILLQVVEMALTMTYVALTDSPPCLNATEDLSPALRAVPLPANVTALMSKSFSVANYYDDNGVFEPARLVMMLILSPLGEEIVFRQVILSILVERACRITAVQQKPRVFLCAALSAFLFAVLHLNNLGDSRFATEYVVFQLVAATLAGMFFALHRLRARSLLSCIAIHFVNNLFSSFISSKAEDMDITSVLLWIQLSFSALSFISLIVYEWNALLTLLERDQEKRTERPQGSEKQE